MRTLHTYLCTHEGDTCSGPGKPLIPADERCQFAVLCIKHTKASVARIKVKL